MSIYGGLSEGNVLKGTVSGGQSLSGSAEKINVIKGESAYQLAVLNGFEGTEAEWLESLHGRDGKSAYEYAKEKGYDGTEEEFAEMLANAGSGGGGGIIEETDPTVPSWAKQTNKPTYSKSEVGLGNVDNVRQYSASNPPPYPVTSVNGKTGAVTVSVPTQTSQLNNNSGFITKAVSDLANYYLKSETLTKAEINALVSAIPKFTISVVSSLPTSNISETTVYLVKSGTGGDLYTEYIRVNNAWEILGSQKVDLTGYALKEEIPTKLSELDNDSGYITKAVSDLVNYYKKSEVYSKDEIDKKGFLTEHQDISGKLDANKLPEAINEALAQAKESGEFDGADGKSAYEYARDGGYTGTEAEFAAKLAAEYIPANTPTDHVAIFGTDYHRVEIGDGDITFMGQGNEGVYFYCENGDGTLVFYGLSGDQAVRLENIATPINDGDATNKGYVDDKFADQAETWTFTLEDGSTVTKKVVIA